MSTSSDTPRPPRLVPGALYSRQDILTNLKIANGTLSKWNKLPHGLHPVGPGTNSDFYLADDIIRFFITHRDRKPESEE